MNSTKKAYDLPTRLFHWSFAFLFVTAFFIAKTIDDDSPTYAYHMLAGLLMVTLVILRIIWGVIGSKYAKFSSFALNPKDLVQYFTSLLSSKTKRVMGHNPASSWAAIVMMLLTLGLGTTGFLMAKGVNKDFFEEIHELFANAFIITVIGHIAGIIIHTIKHKDLIGLSMINGNKNGIENEEGIEKNHTLAAGVFAVIVLSFVIYLKSNYNTTTQNLNLFGTTLQLGEDEKHEGMKGNHESQSKHEKEDDDDD